MKTITVLHTSDWHIGRTLFGRKRYEEFEAFLAWLAETIRQERVDILLVAGDVFDTSAPSNRSQALYYRFLCRIAASSCRHVVAVAGNHDSPTFLDAPKELLRTLNVHVIGAAAHNREDEVLLLKDPQGVPEMIVCAVPYLRDRDIRVTEACESIADKERKLIEGIRGHYGEVVATAKQMRADLGAQVPIIATGHLFVAGGSTVEGDGVRELYVGSLAHVPEAIFPDGIDYLCLGHLHVPQRVNGSELMRYCGSPLPMGFGEAKQQKSVCLVTFAGLERTVKLVDVPVFQKLVRVQGDWQAIAAQLLELSGLPHAAWLEIVYNGEEVISDLRARLDAAVAGTALEILRVRNNRIIDRVMQRMQEDETLDDLNVDDVFQRCLAAHAVPDTQHAVLLRTYRETLVAIDDADTLAE